MKRIEATIGYREEYDNGEIRYFSDWSGQGYVYKDLTAFEKKEGVAYIREALFEHASEDYGREYVTREQIEKEGGDICTYAEMRREAWDYFKAEIPKGYPYTEQFLAYVCYLCFDLVDWQGFDLMLEELSLEDYQEEGATPYPWNWEPDKKHEYPWAVQGV